MSASKCVSVWMFACHKHCWPVCDHVPFEFLNRSRTSGLKKWRIWSLYKRWNLFTYFDKPCCCSILFLCVIYSQFLFKYNTIVHWNWNQTSLPFRTEHYNLVLVLCILVMVSKFVTVSLPFIIFLLTRLGNLGEVFLFLFSFSSHSIHVYTHFLKRIFQCSH